MLSLKTSAVVLIACLATYAQDKPKDPAPISNDEKIELLQADREKLEAYSEMQAAVQQSPQFKRFQAALATQEALWNKIFESRKITQQQYQGCDGPQPGPCAAVKKGEIVLLPIPKPEAKK